jgi:hypothetical protein
MSTNRAAARLDGGGGYGRADAMAACAQYHAHTGVSAGAAGWRLKTRHGAYRRK